MGSPSGSSRPARGVRVDDFDPNVNPKAEYLKFKLQHVLEQFFRGLDDVQVSWRWPSDAAGEWQGKKLLTDTMTDGLTAMRRARDDFEQLRRTQICRYITPPRDQTAVQYLSELASLVEEAWHLCRFLHVYAPDARPHDPDSQRLVSEMNERLPAIRDTLWQEWRRLGLVAEVEVGVSDLTPSTRISGPSQILDPNMAKELKKLTKVAIAMQLVQEHPEWSDRSIAKEAGYRSHSSLSRNQTYQRAAAMARGKKQDIPRGRKDEQTRVVEAWEEPARED